jgi:gamma-glutamyltranspeptidase / glutathione hydrolase
MLNNGMYWFDPRPGHANSAGPAKKPLANMAPLVATGPGGWPRLGLRSSGGRRILSANLQLVLATVDGGLPLAVAL